MSVQNVGTGSVDAFYQNRTWELTFALKTPDGDALNLSDVDVTFSVAPIGSMTAPVITKTIGDGVTVLDAPNGLIYVTVPEDETDYSGTYAYEVVAEPVSGKFTYGSGQITIKPSITI